MFKFGKKAGVLGIVTIVLSVVPLVLTLALLPQMGDQIPMRFGEAGEVLRYGSKLEIFIAPVVTLMLGLATVANGFRQAEKYRDEPSLAKLTFERFVRNGAVACAALFVASCYLLYTAVTGHPLF